MACPGAVASRSRAGDRRGPRSASPAPAADRPGDAGHGQPGPAGPRPRPPRAPPREPVARGGGCGSGVRRGDPAEAGGRWPRPRGPPGRRGRWRRRLPPAAAGYGARPGECGSRRPQRVAGQSPRVTPDTARPLATEQAGSPGRGARRRPSAKKLRWPAVGGLAGEGRRGSLRRRGGPPGFGGPRARSRRGRGGPAGRPGRQPRRAFAPRRPAVQTYLRRGEVQGHRAGSPTPPPSASPSRDQPEEPEVLRGDPRSGAWTRTRINDLASGARRHARSSA